MRVEWQLVVLARVRTALVGVIQQSSVGTPRLSAMSRASSARWRSLSAGRPADGEPREQIEDGCQIALARYRHSRTLSCRRPTADSARQPSPVQENGRNCPSNRRHCIRYRIRCQHVSGLGRSFLLVWFRCLQRVSSETAAS
jgi:hypothetical protein